MFLDMTSQECRQAAPVGRVTMTTFDKLEIGQKCRVMLGGKVETVEKTERKHWGPSVRNARKCHGRRGWTYVYLDRLVEVIP